MTITKKYDGNHSVFVLVHNEKVTVLQTDCSETEVDAMAEYYADFFASENPKVNIWSPLP